MVMHASYTADDSEIDAAQAAAHWRWAGDYTNEVEEKTKGSHPGCPFDENPMSQQESGERR